MSALDDLIAAVEAGGDAGHIDFYTALGEITDGDLDLTARNAYRGSLDAAKALHEALLPGWGWHVDINGIAHFVHADYDEIRVSSTNPARAWLLAILLALKAQGATQ